MGLRIFLGSLIALLTLIDILASSTRPDPTKEPSIDDTINALGAQLKAASAAELGEANIPTHSGDFLSAGPAAAVPVVEETPLPASFLELAKPVTTSLSQVSFSHTQHSVEHLDAKTKSKMMQATVCFYSPCKWEKGDPRIHRSGYYTQPDQLLQKVQQAGQPVKYAQLSSLEACPGAMKREWTTCNDGTMSPDGCRGYCAADPMPGYVSMMTPSQGNAQPFSVRLVTKGELDLLREQLDKRWKDMFSTLTATLENTQKQITSITKKEEEEGSDNSNLIALLKQEAHLRRQQGDQIVKKMEEFRGLTVDALQKVEVQNQRTMMAALHGSSGLCCCWYPSGGASPNCKWYPFKGDVDITGNPRMSSFAQKQSVGAVTDFGINGMAGPTTIRCGENEDGEQMFAYPVIFASKNQFDRVKDPNADPSMPSQWSEGEQGPFYFQSRILLDMCVADKNWKHYMNFELLMDRSNPSRSLTNKFQFVAYDFKFPIYGGNTLKSMELEMQPNVMLDNSEKMWFEVSGDIKNWDVPMSSDFKTPPELENVGSVLPQAADLLAGGSRAQGINIQIMRGGAGGSSALQESSDSKPADPAPSSFFEEEEVPAADKRPSIEDDEDASPLPAGQALQEDARPPVEDEQSSPLPVVDAE